MPAVTTKGYRAWNLLKKAATRPVDIILDNDSNGLFSGLGYDSGFVTAMLALFGSTSMYADTLRAFREAVDTPATNGTGGGGQSVGYGVAGDKALTFRSGGGGQASKDVAGNAVLAAFWNSRLDPGAASSPNNCNHLGESWWNSTSDPVANPAKQNGITMNANQPLGAGNVAGQQLQYQLWRARFSAADGGGSNVADIWWLENGSATNQFNGLSMSNTTTDVPLTPLTLDLPITGRASNSNFEIRRQSPAANSSTAYPFAAFFQRVLKKTQATGFAVSPFYSVGGAKATDVVAYMQAMTVARICNYLKALMYQQTALGFEPMAVIFSMFGINEHGGSVSKATYKAAVEAEFNLWRQVWATCGYKPQNLAFVACPGHPKVTADGGMTGYREAAAELASEGIDVSAIDYSKLATYEELHQGATIPRYFNSGNDTAHLEVVTTDNNSYNPMASRLLAALRDSPTDGLLGASGSRFAASRFRQSRAA